MEFLTLVLEMFSVLYFSKKPEMVGFRSQIKMFAFRCPQVGQKYKQSIINLGNKTFPKADGVVVNTVSRTSSTADQMPALGSSKSLPKVTRS